MKTNHNFLEKILIILFMNFESFKEFLFDLEKIPLVVFNFLVFIYYLYN